MAAHKSERDVAYWTSSRLSGAWSSLDSFGMRLDAEILEAVTNQFSRLEPMVRVRLLLSTLFVPSERVAVLRPALDRLAEVAASEDDEWVRVVGAAVGRFDGRLHIDEVQKESTLVETTIRQLGQELEAGAGAAGFRPLEEIYLSHRLQKAKGLDPNMKPPAHGHFTLREDARLELAQQFDMQESELETLDSALARSSSSVATPMRTGGGRLEETDMFMERNPVKGNVTIAGLGTIGRVDTRRTAGRMKQLDVDEAIAAQEMSRQLADRQVNPDRTPRSARRSNQNDDEGPSASTTPMGGAQNPFYSSEGLGMGGPTMLTAQPVGSLSAKRMREWEGGG
eukprot:CAMPEP_0177793830 /NCGR_PEP_ID=MMETSP0491_2-20121128/25301_1 /TAXON_ID=63592 /ORGANISM="Tetraselmis chuii, Strain PLY429" /LENGTH=338 /DNA_ID=CAMNT_0019316405 /DNA_START=108 /DNA_END=1120 /DNA_ORIENTATION=-